MVPYSPASANALFRSIAQGLQMQMAAFFASHGTIVITPSPAGLFEVPVFGPLSEDLNFIP
jgi:hypothetical protein